MKDFDKISYAQSEAAQGQKHNCYSCKHWKNQTCALSGCEYSALGSAAVTECVDWRSDSESDDEKADHESIGWRSYDYE